MTKNTVIGISGISGAGKSTLPRSLSIKHAKNRIGIIEMITENCWQFTSIPCSAS